MSEVKFDLKPVNEKPSRKYRKGSKYDPILDSFLSGEHDLVKVEVANKDLFFQDNMKYLISFLSINDVILC